ncbi:MAG: sigma 54-interacting transcriptional regulator [Pseudomonadota bacterium]
MGSCWHEPLAGTNGVSMALNEREAFTVRGDQHYFSTLRPFVCTGMPLFDAEDEVIGSIGLAALDRGFDRTELLSRRVLRETSRRLQHLLFAKAFRDDLVIEIASNAAEGFFPTKELIAVDDRGVIKGATHQAAEKLGVASREGLLGEALEGLIETDLRQIESSTEASLDARLGVRLSRRPHMASAPSAARPPIPLSRNRARRRLAPTLRELSHGDPQMTVVLERAQLHFAERNPMLIEGETGAGKSALITALRNAEGLSSSEVVIVNCGLMEGDQREAPKLDRLLAKGRMHEALTDVRAEKILIVLDDVECAPPAFQASLTGFLADIEAGDDRIATDRATPNLRIIATSKGSLRAAVERGALREDLFYLLCGARLSLPPLRRRTRLEELAARLASRMAGAPIEFTEEAVDLIRGYSWPGNVREMINVLRQAILEGDGGPISAHRLRLGEDERPGVADKSSDAKPLVRRDKRTELADALAASGWNVSKAARMLGISRATIHRRMNALGIARPKTADQPLSF